MSLKDFESDAFEAMMRPQAGSIEDITAGSAKDVAKILGEDAVVIACYAEYLEPLSLLRETFLIKLKTPEQDGQFAELGPFHYYVGSKGAIN